MRVRYTTLLAYLLPFMFILQGCSGHHGVSSDQKPVVMVTVSPLEYFAKAIGGDAVEVVTLAPGATDPETFEPTVAQMRDASQADVILTVGLFPFEEKLLKSVKASNPSAVSATLADSVPVILGTHGDDTEADPHIWLSLRNARTMARTAARTLSQALPSHNTMFASRLAELEQHIDSLDNVITSRLTPAKGASFIVGHPSLSYFAKDYGLHQIALEEEHKESSVSSLRRNLEKAKEMRPLVYFTQQQLDIRSSHPVSEATGLEPVSISPLSPHIEATILTAADAIAAAQAK